MCYQEHTHDEDCHSFEVIGDKEPKINISMLAVMTERMVFLFLSTHF